jgi:hypothetical protein
MGVKSIVYKSNIKNAPSQEKNDFFSERGRRAFPERPRPLARHPCLGVEIAVKKRKFSLKVAIMVGKYYILVSQSGF